MPHILYNSNCLYEDKQGYTYSCDMVRLQGLVSENKKVEKEFRYYFEDPKNIRVSDMITCLGTGKYKFLWSIACQNTSITVLHCFNGFTHKADDERRVILEFNPNKMLYDDFNEIDKILRCLVEVSIVRCDLAIDIPIERKFANLLKGNKNYEYHDYNHNGITEYLGVRNEIGFTKLYDKKIESKLDKPMTRLEITCKPQMIDFRKRVPRVLVCQDNFQKELQLYDNITKNQMVTISMLQSLDVNTRIYALKSFTKYMRKKISPYVLADTYELELDYHCIQSVFDWLSNCVYYKTFKR